MLFTMIQSVAFTLMANSHFEKQTIDSEERLLERNSVNNLIGILWFAGLQKGSNNANDKRLRLGNHIFSFSKALA